MAIGLMRMFGFRILENFNYPYIARSIREFWRRWHISLSNWFRDYLYIPLGGNQRGERRAYANLVIVFLLCGLWHGASWPFVLWGVWHGAFLVAERAGVDGVLRSASGRSRTSTRCWRSWAAGCCSAATRSRRRSQYYARAGRLRASGDPARHPLPEFLDPFVAFTLCVGVVFATPLARASAQWRDRVAARPGLPRRVVLGRRRRVARRRVLFWPARSWRPAPTIRSSTSGSDGRAADPLVAAAGAAAGAGDASAARPRRRGAVRDRARVAGARARLDVVAHDHALREPADGAVAGAGARARISRRRSSARSPTASAAATRWCVSTTARCCACSACRACPP